MTGTIRGRIVGILTALLCLWALVMAPIAAAHATVVSTDPASDAVLPTAPTRVTVTYSEPVELELGALRVYAPDGSEVDNGSAAHLDGKPETASVTLKAGLKNGTYLASWRVVSADSHPVRGAWTFSIGAPSATSASGSEAAPGGDRTVGVLYGVLRWVAYLGFACLAGTAFLLLLAAPNLTRDHRVRRLLGGGWFALLLGTVGALLLQGPYGGGFGLGKAFDVDVLQATLHTRLGRTLAWRLILLGAAGVLVSWIATQLVSASKRARLVAGALGAALAAALAWTWSRADHSGTGSQVALALPADILHLLAMAAWVGGLAALSVSVLGARPMAVDGTDEERAAVVRRFSSVAFAAVCVLAATGVYQAWRELRGWHALFATDYGVLLQVKTGCFVVLIALGYIARKHLAMKSPDLRTLRKSVGLEFGIAVAVLAVTALLVESQPGAAAVDAKRVVSTSEPFDTGQSDGRGTGTVNITLDPARVGNDTLHVYVLDKSGQQEQVAEVTASLALPAQQIGPLPVPLADAGPGHYQGSGAVLPMAGTWEVIVTIRTTDVDQTAVILNVDVTK